MLSARLPLTIHALEKSHVRNDPKVARAAAIGTQRCLAGADTVILLHKRSRNRPLQQKSLAGATEAVFSSSEDRVRASHTTYAVARPPIASRSVSGALAPQLGLVGPPRTEQSESHRGSLRRILSSSIAQGLFAVLFPSDCRVCGVPLVKISRLPVCQQCLDAMLPISGGLCAICGERIFSPYAVSGSAGPLCGLCSRIKPLFERAVAYGSYEDGLRELIHLLKYGGVRPSANVLGRMLAEAITSLHADLPPDAMMIPVPLHRTKFRQRGFNQAELIARAAIKIRGAARPLHLRTDIFVRKRNTASQIGLTGHQRRANLRGAFAVTRPTEIKGREVIVVDDVYTTGATVSECARILLRAGATKIWVATVARTLKVSAQHVDIGPHENEIEPRWSGSGNAAWDAPLRRAASG
jgi:ComF family protein